MERIIKLGIGVERPGEIVYEVKLHAVHPQKLAAHLRDPWTRYTARVEAHPDEEVLLHLIVEFEEDGMGDFELEDELLGLLDP